MVLVLFIYLLVINSDALSAICEDPGKPVLHTACDRNIVSQHRPKRLEKEQLVFGWGPT